MMISMSRNYKHVDRSTWVKAKRRPNSATHLGEIEVTLLLKPLKVRIHLPQLRLQILDCFVGLGGAGSVAGDWCATTSSRGTSVEASTSAGTGSRGTEGGGSRRGVGGSAASTSDGVVALAAVVGVPEPFGPLEEFEVISEIGEDLRKCNSESGGERRTASCI